MRFAVLCAVAGLVTGCDRLFLDPRATVVDAPTILPCVPATSHDEDRDGRPDDCDPCPSIADADADADADGVGDACDPEPTARCQRRVLFDGFGDPTSNRPIKTLGWQFANDDLVQLDPAGDNQIAHWPDFTNVTVRVAMFVAPDAFDVTQPASLIEIGSGVAVVNTNQRDTGIACRFERRTTTGFSAILADLDTGAFLDANPYNGDGTDDLGETVFELVNHASGAVSCRIDAQTGLGTAATTIPAPMTDGAVIIYLDDAAVRVHWIDVVQRTCP